MLCKFLENSEFFPPGYWNGKRVVDIGSGTGVAGLAAAVLGSGRRGWLSTFDAFFAGYSYRTLNQTILSVVLNTSSFMHWVCPIDKSQENN